MINCELFYFAMLPMPRSCTHLDSLSRFGLAFRSKSGFKHQWHRFGFAISGSGFKLRPVYNYGLQVVCILTNTFSFVSWQNLM